MKEIMACFDCIDFHDGQIEQQCKAKNNKRIRNSNVIQKWCPRPDASQQTDSADSLCRECGSETGLVGVEHPICDDCAKQYR